MKILFIANGFPPHRWAGTETYTAGIAEEMSEIGHEIDVLCVGEWKNGNDYWNGVIKVTESGISVTRINLNWEKAPDPNRYLYKNPVVGAYLDKYLKKIKPDLVHVTSCETMSASVLEVVKRHQIPLVLSITDFWFLCPTINLLRIDGKNCDGITTQWDCLKCMAGNAKIYKLPRTFLPEKVLELLLITTGKIPLISRQSGFRGLVGNVAERKKYLRETFSLPDVRLTASAFVKEVYRKAGFDDPVRLHPYGHDLSWVEQYTGKLPSKKLRLGFIGQIIHPKGVHVLLEALNQLEDSVRESVSLSIYGNPKKNPSYSAKLQELANTLGNVEFCGTYPHDSSASIFSRIDILVVPSLWFDFPLIIEEAFATKTPVIATRLGQMAETVIDEINGLLFERGNSKDLAKQIERLVREPGLLKKLEAGIPQVKTVSEEVNELETVYRGLSQPQENQKV